ncbi:MAG: trypsin-like peptidase domain-containing protein [Isosphaeraceae bacterium]
MASFNPHEFGFEDPPPRPSTPPVRRGFLLVLFVLSVAALIVYGVDYIADRVGYAWESGRARAASEALAKLDEEGIVARASALFRMATTAVSPAVVNVQSFVERRGGEGLRGSPLGGDRMGPAIRSAELGSGVVIDKEKGYIVTNNHVVKDADHILVRLGPGDDVPARLVGADPKSDLAVLQVKAALRVQAEWGDSNQLDNGDWVLAIGSPLGFDHSVTAGIVSATERNDVRITEYESFIQTDAAINPGNSGGPLIDLSGKVVGINTAIITQSGGYEGIGLAIPSALARRVVESLIKEGKVVRGYLGVRIQPLNTAMARDFGLPNNRGALIGEVQPGSPAEHAGLKSGDVIIKVADRDVADPSSLRNLTAGLDVGAQVPVIYYRAGKPHTVSVTIDELPPAPEVLSSLGFTVRDHPAGPEGGAPGIEIDRVVTGSPAFQAGLRPRMRILAVGQESVATVAQFETAVRNINAARGLPLVVQSNDGRVGPILVGGDRDIKQP